MTTATPTRQQLPAGIGFTDPVRDSQAVFRHVLDALARPGDILTVADTAEAPPPLHAAAAAICLALVDFETRLWLDPTARDSDVVRYLRFHCGATLVGAPADADFAVIAGSPPPLGEFNTGSDAFPDEGATVIIQSGGIDAGGALELSGPGIDGSRRVSISGVADGFWSQRADVVKGFPRGLDLIFTAGAGTMAIPRTTTVTTLQAGA